MIVCTAFTVCTRMTASTKNIPTFEAHRKYESKSCGACLCEKKKSWYDDLQVFVEHQIENMSNVMIHEITQYMTDCNIPSSLKALLRKKYNYIHFMCKFEDVPRLVGCTGVGGAVVCTLPHRITEEGGTFLPLCAPVVHHSSLCLFQSLQDQVHNVSDRLFEAYIDQGNDKVVFYGSP